MELQDCWTEVSRNVRQAYSVHKEDGHDEIDVEKMKQLVTRLAFKTKMGRTGEIFFLS